VADGGSVVARPRAILWFEGLYLISLLVSAWGVIAVFSTLVGVPAPERTGAALVAAITLCVLAGLVLLVSRRRNHMAKWVLVILTALTTAFWLLMALGYANALDGPGLVQHLLQVVAVALLFTAPARAWLEKPEDAA